MPTEVRRRTTITTSGPLVTAPVGAKIRYYLTTYVVGAEGVYVPQELADRLDGDVYTIDDQDTDDAVKYDRYQEEVLQGGGFIDPAVADAVTANVDIATALDGSEADEDHTEVATALVSDADEDNADIATALASDLSEAYDFDANYATAEAELEAAVNAITAKVNAVIDDYGTVVAAVKTAVDAIAVKVNAHIDDYAAEIGDIKAALDALGVAVNALTTDYAENIGDIKTAMDTHATKLNSLITILEKNGFLTTTP